MDFRLLYDCLQYNIILLRVKDMKTTNEWHEIDYISWG